MPTQDKPTRRVLQQTTAATRRRITSQLYLTGRYRMEDIAVELGERYNIQSSPATVSLDLKYARELNEATTTRNIAEWVRIELEKLDHLEDMLMANSQPAMFLGEGNVLDLVEAIEEFDGTAKRTSDKTAELMLKIADRRSKLLGLDAPKKVAVEGGDLNKPIRTTDLSDDELEQIILASAVKAAEEPQT